VKLCEDKSFFLVCACVMLAGLSAQKLGVLVEEDWRTNPCVVVVILVVTYGGTWDFTTWCGHKGGNVVWTRVRLQQGWLL